MIYRIEEARAQQLALLLPESTPSSLSITALDGVKLKEFGSEIVGRQRRWNVLLAEPQRDRVRLAVDFQQPLGVAGAARALPCRSCWPTAWPISRA